MKDKNQTTKENADIVEYFMHCCKIQGMEDAVQCLIDYKYSEKEHMTALLCVQIIRDKIESMAGSINVKKSPNSKRNRSKKGTA